MKTYAKLAGLVCLLSSNIWAGSDYMVFHNHTGKHAVLSYQVGKETLQLVAGPGMSVSNIVPAPEYRMISLTLDEQPVKECEGIVFNAPYAGINLAVSGFKQITCRAVVHGKS